MFGCGGGGCIPGGKGGGGGGGTPDAIGGGGKGGATRQILSVKQQSNA